MNRLPSCERRGSLSLEAIVERHQARLEEVAKPGAILTYRRLHDIGHPKRPAVEDADVLDIGWPDEMNAVRFPHGSRVENFLGTELDKADEVFVMEILQENEYLKASSARVPGIHGYNNFPALLQAKPDRLQPGQSFADLYRNNPASAVYGTKPYLWRAYMLEPDFMHALHDRTLVSERAGRMTGWKESLLRGASSPGSYPADAAFLRASRVSYMMLMNLMRADDLVRQKAWVDMPFENSALILDPDVEVCT